METGTRKYSHCREGNSREGGGVWDVSAFQARRQGDVQVGCITAGKRPGKGSDGYFNGEVSPGD